MNTRERVVVKCRSKDIKVTIVVLLLIKNGCPGAYGTMPFKSTYDFLADRHFWKEVFITEDKR